MTDIIVPHYDHLTTTCLLVSNIINETIIKLELIGEHLCTIRPRPTIREISIEQGYLLSNPSAFGTLQTLSPTDSSLIKEQLGGCRQREVDLSHTTILVEHIIVDEGIT
jgi:hypothetical protein